MDNEEDIKVLPVEWSWKELLRVHMLNDDRGLLSWRWGTGDNVEITHFKSTLPGNGYGLSLLRDMLKALKGDPPYCTVFGFTRTCNKAAQAFYQNVGFTLSPVQGVYADGDAVVFSANYKELCTLHGV